MQARNAPESTLERDQLAVIALQALIGRLPEAKGAGGMQVLVSELGEFDAAQYLAQQAYMLADAMLHIRTLPPKEIRT